MPKRKSEPIQVPRGMKDILPNERYYWEKVIGVLEKNAGNFGFRFIKTPIAEDIRLFERTTGESTEIVEKQMYVLKNRGDGDVALCLRPEGTPGVARAYLEHGMNAWPQPVKLFYHGPFFRYERPQAGRYRQFFQFGFEVIGDKSPVLDAQIIQLVYNSLVDLGIVDISVQINSLGCPECRSEFKKKLNSYLRNKGKYLCADCKRRTKMNPLRFLDCKQEKCQAVIEQAPQIVDSLCPDCCGHFKMVLEFLDVLEIPYILNHKLVRGLDYYTKTVFEIWVNEEVVSSEENAEKSGENIEGTTKNQIALGGGGRYDNLIEAIGGKETPALGAALGIERIIAILKKNKSKLNIKPSNGPQVFLVQLGDMAKKKCLKLFQDLIKARILVGEAFCKDSMKSQLKIANKVGAKYALIVGQKEALDDTVIMRDMESGAQETVLLEKAIKLLKTRLKKD